jgi:hypothetical protein
VNDAGEACLTDIGTSIIPYPHDWTMADRESARWMAPEVMDPGPDTGADTGEYAVTPKSDVYSFAMTTLEVQNSFIPATVSRLIATRCTRAGFLSLIEDFMAGLSLMSSTDRDRHVPPAPS